MSAIAFLLILTSRSAPPAPSPTRAYGRSAGTDSARSGRQLGDSVGDGHQAVPGECGDRIGVQLVDPARADRDGAQRSGAALPERALEGPLLAFGREGLAARGAERCQRACRAPGDAGQADV